MKIVRKERIDVKKYMEDMKVNKTATKRTFTSMQERTTHPNDRLSRDKLMNQFDNYSNNSLPQFSRPTYRNQSYIQGNSRTNLYSQLDIMSQTSHNYRQNYAPHPPMIVPQVNPNLYYNQMTAFYGTSPYPQTQYMYQNVNNSHEINNYEFPPMNQVVSQMKSQPFEVTDKQNVNSKPQLLNQCKGSIVENKVRNISAKQVIACKNQTNNEINARQAEMGQIEDNKMVIQSKHGATTVKEMLITLQKKKKQDQKQAVISNQPSTIKQQQKVIKKKRLYKRKQLKQNQQVEQLPQKVKEVPDYIQIAEDVNKQFEEMLQRQRKAETQKYEKEKICMNILTLLDSKLRESYSNINWIDISQQLQRTAIQNRKINTGGKKSVKKHMTNALSWLQNLHRRLEIK